MALEKSRLRNLVCKFGIAGSCLALALTVSISSANAHDQEGEKGVNNSSGAGAGGSGPFASSRVELLSHMELSEIGNLGASNVIGNDIWGWTDETSGREFALFGLTNGTSFIEITDPEAPTYLGTLKTTEGTGNRAWRDIKVYNEQAYIVSDLNGAHGVQVFDLNQLLTASASDASDPHYFSAVGVYDGVTTAHNIVINEDSGFAYVVGSNVASGGLHVLDLNGGANGAMPTFVGNFSADGYTHDAQVVNYVGPDSDYAGREVAFNSNEDTLTIVDVTDKENMTEISRNGYAGAEYSHQGWLSEDQKYFFLDDELDERNSDTLIKTRTRVWDVSDLDAPTYLGFHEGTESTIDHNLYVKDEYIFQANYTSGLRVLKVNDAATLDIEEWAYFDTYMADNNVTFNGAWSVFPYFDSGSVIVSDRQGGLFVLNVIPEPGSMAVLGMLGLIVASRRRRVA
ncbi:MAG: choice-of-anchor B family protein [Mariniblastus sp.]